MAQRIKFKIKVHSDHEIENPGGYFYKIFRDDSRWKIIDVTGPTMTVESCQFRVNDVADIEPLFDRITPAMYESTDRSYRIVA